MRKSHKEIALDILQLMLLGLNTKNPQLLLKNVGICDNIAFHVFYYRYPTLDVPDDFRIRGVLRVHMETWRSLHGGPNATRLFPINGEIEYKIEAQKGTLWDNPRRVDLLKYLIAELEKEIANETAK